MLCFGLVRPYKGIDVLVEAWKGDRATPSCGSWAPRAWTPRRCAPPRRPACASSSASSPTGEAAAFFRRADLAVLPYREIEQSGVLYTALGFAVPLVLSDVGGFPEVAAAGAAELVAPGDAGRAARRPASSLLEDPRAARALRDGRAARWPTSRYGWDAIARAHLELYETLLA